MAKGKSKGTETEDNIFFCRLLREDAADLQDAVLDMVNFIRIALDNGTKMGDIAIHLTKEKK